ncbi:universal stress protein [Frateuria aurantia]
MTAPILIAIDGASEAEVQLQLATRHALALGAVAEVICVIDPDRDPATTPPPMLSGDTLPNLGPSQAQLDADQAIRKAVELLRDAGVEANGHVATGEPSRLICTYASNHGCQLIVLGHRYRHWFAKLREGSVCHAVIEQATCPVLIQPPHCKNL